MRLLLSATTSVDGEPVDLAVDCDDNATVGDVARKLADQLAPASAPEPQIIRAAGRHLGVVDDALQASTATAAPPTLYVGSEPLDPGVLVRESRLHNGVLVGIDVPPGDVFAERRGVVEVRIVAGRGSGTVNSLAPGTYTAGTAPTAAIRIDDPDLPETVFQLDVTLDGTVTVTPDPAIIGQYMPPPEREEQLEGPIIIPKQEDEKEKKKQQKRKRRRRYKKLMKELDRLKNPHLTINPEEDRPLAHLDRVPLEGPTVWQPGTALVVGEVMFELKLPAAPDASLSASPSGVTLDYNRPPRLLPPPRQTEFRLPSEPKKPTKSPVPWVMALSPMLMGGTMFLLIRSPYSLMIMLLAPLMLFFRYRHTKKHRRNTHAEQMENYVERMQHISNQAYEALVKERGARRHDMPDPAAMLLFATGPRARLWERRRTDPDWMRVRIGMADIPSEVALSDPGREDHERTLRWTAPDVPVGVDMAEAGVTGVMGADGLRTLVAEWMVAQTAALHSPADLDVVVLSDPEGDEAWNWVRWLPHVRRGDDADVIAGVGTDDETTNRRVAELMSIMEARKAARDDKGSGMGANRNMSFPPLLVVLDGARRIRLIPGLVTLLSEGPSLGMVFLCIDREEQQLPEECRAVVRVGPGSTSQVRVTGVKTVEGVRADFVPPGWCERLGRALAPIKDVSKEDLSSTLPSSSRLLDVLKLDPVTSEAIERWWTQVGRSTRAMIGEGSDGPFAIDVRADGPHGLVAGTTGSGKSELLQTIIASLAVANRPDEFTFVLVDYKGGAAFKDCNNLPHTVGMVTDLDGHLTTRALDSLAAELHRREHQLAEAGAKDIEDYLAGKGPDDEPMPRLMIVIDEFAALVAELPDFVKGLVDIARRGRSLGVHLILATQRPAGVVSAEIKSNTNLRIALRVTDRSDSQDVIESPESAEIAKSLPGRAYARLGHSSLVQFQSARVGGRPLSPDAGVAVDLRELSWQSIGRPDQGGGGDGAEEDVSIPTDLESLVTAINETSDRTGVKPPPPPWLPPLDDIVTLDQLFDDQGASVKSGSRVRIPIGMVDRPKEQSRSVAYYDLSGGHLAVIGAPRSGRSTALRAVAGVVGRELSPGDVHLYGVDCGNNALLPMVGLPHTGAVVSRDQPDRLARLTSRIRGEIGRRQQLLAEQGFADVEEQRANSPEERRLPYIVVLFDRWEGFKQAFDSYDSGALVDTWMQIMQEGTGVGVKMVLTADRTGLLGRLGTLLDDKLMLRMTDHSDFTAIGLPAKEVPEHMPPGRGFRSEGVHETQIALLAEDDSGTAQVAALQEIGREASERFADMPRKQRPFRVDPLPTKITLSDAMELLEKPLASSEIPIAVGGDTLTLRTLDANDHGPGMLVLGPRRSGRSATLLTMTTSMLERDWKVLLVTPRRSPLRDLAGHDGVQAVVDLEKGKDDILPLFDEIAPGKGKPPSAVVIDDVELIGVDGWLVDAVTKHLGKLRDSGSVIVAAGTTDDLGSSYRGPVAALKKSRSGLLLSPGSMSDGDHFGIKLPRSMTGGMPPGRGLYVAAGQWQLVQVPETTRG
ncbi:cell division-like protein [Actinobacteria bacterium YIM 96077]|uniref:Cell division-like protein n=1 Tax=Phytoactinopolyspora halophila TaxID=1981511 RepID=A0A329R381_9ACTN|nr:FtsK/SpoIIIE domain-containing protein [Phytoactinopolyspora halophila]AYY12221.1 cell division-like protein [Actinobacteria bacterium YIM 96077]RAW18546.1 cell division-like protein [Phytoactinopolyspora halophila]